MIYHTTEKIERIFFAPRGYTDDIHYIDLHKSDDKCYVTIDGGCNDWMWVFKLDDPANYELVKHMIMDVMFQSCCMDAFMESLDDMFEECFAEILADDECDDECVCCGGCNCDGCTE